MNICISIIWDELLRRRRAGLVQHLNDVGLHNSAVCERFLRSLSDRDFYSEAERQSRSELGDRE